MTALAVKRVRIYSQNIYFKKRNFLPEKSSTFKFIRMTDTQAVKEYYTKEEYLAFEEASPEKHEYERGKVITMSGGSANHGYIGGNMYAALKAILKANGKPCRAVNSDVKIYVKNADSYVYPDGFVVCGDTEYHNIKNDGVINPILVVEVLSPSTIKHDRGAKFRKYCSLPSFKEYVLIAQDEPVVEVLFRDIDFWRMTTTVGLDRSVKLNSLDIEIPMALIYEDVDDLPTPQFGLDF